MNVYTPTEVQRRNIWDTPTIVLAKKPTTKMVEYMICVKKMTSVEKKFIEFVSVKLLLLLVVVLLMLFILLRSYVCSIVVGITAMPCPQCTG